MDFHGIDAAWHIAGTLEYSQSGASTGTDRLAGLSHSGLGCGRWNATHALDVSPARNFVCRRAVSRHPMDGKVPEYPFELARLGSIRRSNNLEHVDANGCARKWTDVVPGQWLLWHAIWRVAGICPNRPSGVSHYTQC